MNVANWAIVVVAAIAAGATIGTTFGFGITAHNDILRGVRPNTTSRLLLWLCRPSSQFSSAETLGLFTLLVAWFMVFLGLVGVPIVVATKLIGAEAVSIAFAIFVVGVLAGHAAGRKAWKGMAHAA